MSSFGQTGLPVAKKSARLSNYFTVTATMSSATWNTVASHEIATVTGTVLMRVLPQCTGTLTDAADGASIQFGYEGATSAIIGSDGAAGAGAVTITNGQYWTPDGNHTFLYESDFNGQSLDLLTFVPGLGLDVGYEITGAALTGGTLVFHVWWEPLDSTGSVTAGAGGSL